ncbi:MAG TPA: ThuA domain-containing protein, partial [Gemmataceae bacterium]
LYQLRYADRQHPQPVAAWAEGPREVRVAFDRPIDPWLLLGLARQTKITYGTHVRAGDRFESLWPGYEVVAREKVAPRYDLPVYRAEVTADRRTLLLTTAPMRSPVHYAVELPGLGRVARRRAPEGALIQRPAIDLDFTLTGVRAEWKPEGGAAWEGWLPHLDPDVARAFTEGSEAHERLWAGASGRGTLRLVTKLDLHDMLRPAFQPGTKPDQPLPPETVTLVLSSDVPVKLTSAAGKVGQARGEGGAYEARLTVTPRPSEPVPVEVTLACAAGLPRLGVTWHTAEDPRARALPLHRMLLPWAERTAPDPGDAPVARVIPELEGASWKRGREVFFSQEAACFKCHAVRGEGGQIGPDLSNLVHRDYASVLRDITQPSFAVNPDYLTYSVELNNGRVLRGTIRTEPDRLLVGDEKGEVTPLPRAELAEIRPVPTSTMPEGLPQQLGEQRMKDLLAFLLTEPPRMPDYGKGEPPPPRTMSEVRAVLAGAPDPPAKTRPVHVVLVAGKKDHGPGEHDYPAWQRAWKQLLSSAEGVKVTTATDWPGAEDFASADVIVFYQAGTWDAKRAKDTDAFLARGGGLVYVHYAVDGGRDPEGFADRIGLAWGKGARFRHGPLELHFQRGSDHPVARNFDKVRFIDETYWRLTGDPGRITPIASAVEEGEPRPMFWTRQQGKGRVFVSILGHYAWTFDDPLFRILLLRGMAWAAKEPVDRFNDLATLGARVKED